MPSWAASSARLPVWAAARARKVSRSKDLSELPEATAATEEDAAGCSTKGVGECRAGRAQIPVSTAF